ncbi:MAG: serine/threonine protein kinase [Deltaproteobacteria bacterium]|nr:serine/threonine protein kinase [Deltaproteobacteria bacterium]MCB9786174.1 serine/threonine protein kinase [Deltaproteobacteria bacterium]
MDDGAPLLAAAGSHASDLRARAFGSKQPVGSTEDARGFLQQRVTTFLAFQAVFMGVFYLIDASSAVGNGGLGALGNDGLVTHLALVLSFSAGWYFARSGDRSSASLQWLEAAATLAICAGVASVAQSIPRTDMAVGPIFAVALTLVCRAGIVPSSGSRTLVLGVVATATVSWAYARRSGVGDPLTAFAVAWTGAFTAASSLVSRVIYGLQREVREAMRLGQYVLEYRLGEGSMGTVFRARHAMLRRPTAVKLLRPSRAGAENLARFEHEVRQTAGLSHPNTVTIYDYGRTPEGVFYYAMELLDGANLDEIVTLHGAQEVGRVVHIVSAVAGALAEAHASGLIHRDIKPANIMLCQQGGMPDVAKVVDFGLVKQLGAPGLTEAGSMTGTPLYMAPEAITAPERVDARSDLYALGAVTWFLLTGRHVFEGRTVIEVCAQHLNAVPERPSAHTATPVPEALERLVMQCLEKDPDRRPASAVEFAERLQPVQALAPWSAAAAREWWRTRGPALQARHEVATDALGETLSVDLAARQEESS